MGTDMGRGHGTFYRRNGQIRSTPQMNAALAGFLLLLLFLLLFYAYLSGPRQQRSGAVITYGFDPGDPTPTYRVDPIYPKKAHQQGIMGYAIVRLVVEGDGSVKNVEVLKSQPSGLFNRAVSHAVKQWRFSPGTWQAGGRGFLFVRVRFDLDWG